MALSGTNAFFAPYVLKKLDIRVWAFVQEVLKVLICPVLLIQAFHLAAIMYKPEGGNS